MKNTFNTLMTIGAFCGAVSVAHAQFTQVVAEDNFDSYTDTSFVVFTDGTSMSLVPDGSGGNAVQYSYDAPATTFMANGFDWNPIVQPGAGGPNTSANRADYQQKYGFTAVMVSRSG